MEGIAKLTAVPIEIEIADQKEMLYPLRFLEWGVLEQWMRSRIVAAAKDALEGLNQREAIIVMKTAHKTASQVSIIHSLRAASDEDGVTYLRSFEGMLRALHLALRSSPARDAKPKYDLKELDEKIGGDIALLNTLFLDILDISFPSIGGEDEEETSEKSEESPSEKN